MTLAGAERAGVPEAIFDPSRLARVRGDGTDGKVGAAALVVAAVEAADPGKGQASWDTKRKLLRGTVLAGGGSLFPGLADRLRTDVRAALSTNGGGGGGSSSSSSSSSSSAAMAAAVEVVAPDGRQWAAWRGGCVVAEFAPTAPEGWMFRAEYDEGGPGAVFDFCFS